MSLAAGAGENIPRYDGAYHTLLGSAPSYFGGDLWVNWARCGGEHVLPLTGCETAAQLGPPPSPSPSSLLHMFLGRGSGRENLGREGRRGGGAITIRSMRKKAEEGDLEPGGHVLGDRAWSPTVNPDIRRGERGTSRRRAGETVPRGSPRTPSSRLPGTGLCEIPSRKGERRFGLMKPREGRRPWTLEEHVS